MCIKFSENFGKICKLFAHIIYAYLSKKNYNTKQKIIHALFIKTFDD